MIVQKLRDIQQRCGGYLPEKELRELSKEIETPLHRIHEVASFYPLYRLTPPPKVDVKVCRDMACHLHGAKRLQQSLEGYAKELGGVGEVEIGGVSCLGQCDSAPALSINDNCYWGIDESSIRGKIRTALGGEHLHHQHADRSTIGWKIDPYDGSPRFDAVRFLVEQKEGSALYEGRKDRVIEALKVANLRGMGGAGFPTHLKWGTVRNAPGDEKYVVCNADESEPGTFKDRELMRRTPYLLIEGMVLAGLIAGATRGYIYIRHEYHEEAEVLEQAIRSAQRAGYCGENILGSGLSFPIEVYVSPGGYIQGEESALLEAMEDRRGEPRNKPPFPVFSGLYNKPTVINNVETLCWTPAIVLHGGEWYRDGGINGASGMRFVSISGDVNEPGVYEVPFGQTVRDLIFRCSGGMSGGQKLKAIATSGPSGGFLPATLTRSQMNTARSKAWADANFDSGSDHYDILDLPLDLNTLGQIDNMLGAAFVAIGSNACMVDFALNCVEFYRNESCGKCVPCRMGSQKLTNILTQITTGTFPGHDLKHVEDLSTAMLMASICGLGQVAANPMTTLMRYFPEELEAHIKHKKCPAGVCKFQGTVTKNGVIKG